MKSFGGSEEKERIYNSVWLHAIPSVDKDTTTARLSWPFCICDSNLCFVPHLCSGSVSINSRKFNPLHPSWTLSDLDDDNCAVVGVTVRVHLSKSDLSIRYTLYWDLSVTQNLIHIFVAKIHNLKLHDVINFYFFCQFIFKLEQKSRQHLLISKDGFLRRFFTAANYKIT